MLFQYVWVLFMADSENILFSVTHVISFVTPLDKYYFTKALRATEQLKTFRILLKFYLRSDFNDLH